MAKRRRRRDGDSRGLGFFAVALTGISLVLSWVAMPAPRAPGAGHARTTATTTPTAGEAPSENEAGDGLLRVHFYDVSQGLAVLVDLPGGRHVLVDTGDAPMREGCGQDCLTAHRHLLAALAQDLAGAPIDLLWITHQHSDHIGGARDVLREFVVRHYVDNGRDGAKPEVARTRDAARARGTQVDFVNPFHPWTDALAAAVPGPARLTPVVPDAWPSDCATDPNDCSLVLRIDFGASSILFTGDAERAEERALPPDAVRGVTLLQVGHHGSETSSSDAFLTLVAPRYAVVSAGHPGTGMNADYCLPRASTLEKVNRALVSSRGGDGADKSILGFDGKSTCRRSHGAGWVAVPASERLWATERDGDVVLATRGDGVFAASQPLVVAP